jgi:hypothetical protein
MDTTRGVPSVQLYASRSAIEWIMERYQVKVDKASGIVNDPNDWATEIGYRATSWIYSSASSLSAWRPCESWRVFHR